MEGYENEKKFLFLTAVLISLFLLVSCTARNDM